jgi:regulator of sirC expression with transglutaminase-like and TPR domain
MHVRAGKMTAAKEDLTRYLELAQSAPDRDQVKEQIQSIQHWLASLN